MGSFTLTNKAKTDLKNIAVYTQREWGREQRLLYIKQFDDAFHSLASNPDLGAKCEHIKTGYRKYPVAKHLVFYRTTKEAEILIVRILHKRMDVESRIGE